MKRILVPLDFSEDSINAMKHALYLASKIKSSVRLMHVKISEEFISPRYFSEVFNQCNRSVEECLVKLIERYQDEYTGGGEFDFVITDGKVYRSILDRARADDAYMIIMGTHGASGFEEYWVGSNAYRVVTVSNYPVLTIRHGFIKKEIQRIILPIDMGKNSRSKVPLVTELAVATGAEVIVLGVRETRRIDIVRKIRQYVSQSIDFMKEKGVQAHGMELHCKNSIADDTIIYGVQKNADLIAIMSDYDENPMNIRIGTTAQQFVNHSPIPVLFVPPPK